MKRDIEFKSIMPQTLLLVQYQVSADSERQHMRDIGLRRLLQIESQVLHAEVTYSNVCLKTQPVNGMFRLG